MAQTISFRCSGDINEFLSEVARDEGVTTSNAIRMLIRLGYERRVEISKLDDLHSRIDTTEKIADERYFEIQKSLNALLFVLRESTAPGVDVAKIVPKSEVLARDQLQRIYDRVQGENHGN